MSQHAQSRAAQRNLPIDGIDYVLDHGKLFHRAGALFYFLRNRDIPSRDQRYEQLTRLAGTAVVVTKDHQTVITIWRNRGKGLKKIKRLS